MIKKDFVDSKCGKYSMEDIHLALSNHGDGFHSKYVSERKIFINILKLIGLGVEKFVISDEECGNLLGLFLEYRTYKIGYGESRLGGYTVIYDEFIQTFKMYCNSEMKNKSMAEEALISKTYAGSILKCLVELEEPYATGYSGK